MSITYQTGVTPMAQYIHEGPALYLTADRLRVVPEGDPQAAFLLVATGGSLPIADVEHWGLTAPKAKPAPANKQRSGPTEDK